MSYPVKRDSVSTIDARLESTKIPTLSQSCHAGGCPADGGNNVKLKMHSVVDTVTAAAFFGAESDDGEVLVSFSFPLEHADEQTFVGLKRAGQRLLAAAQECLEALESPRLLIGCSTRQTP